LKNPGERQIKVPSDGKVLSGPELVNAEWRRKQLAESHPQAIVVEMEGEGENISTQLSCQSKHTATDLHIGQSLSASQVRRLLYQCSAVLCLWFTQHDGMIRQKNGPESISALDGAVD